MNYSGGNERKPQNTYNTEYSLRGKKEYETNIIEEKENEYFSMDNSLINELLKDQEVEEKRNRQSKTDYNPSGNSQIINDHNSNYTSNFGNSPIHERDNNITTEKLNSRVNTDNANQKLKQSVNEKLISSTQENQKINKPIYNNRNKVNDVRYKGNMNIEELDKVNYNNSKLVTSNNINLFNESRLIEEKKKLVEDTEKQNIKFLSSKPKINNNSQIICINKTEKYIEDIVKLYNKNDAVNFIEFGQILTDLKVLTEVFPKNKTEQKEFMSYKNVKTNLISSKMQEKRRKREINFYEQIWIVLNPNNLSSIKVDILIECIKILFCLASSTVKEITIMLNEFLQAAFFLSSNPDEEKNIISPVTDCKMEEKDLWSLDKIVCEFLALKENKLAYKPVHHYRQKSLERLEKIQKENFSFTPNANLNKPGHRKTHSSNFFESRVPAMISREKLRLQILGEMKKENDEIVSIVIKNFRK